MHDLGRQFTTLRELIDAAAAAGVNDGLLRRSARALVDLADRPDPDARCAHTHRLGADIERLAKSGLRRADICVRLNITRHQYRHAKRKRGTTLAPSCA